MDERSQLGLASPYNSMMTEANGHMTDMLIASYLDRRMSDVERDHRRVHIAVGEQPGAGGGHGHAAPAA